MTLTRRQQRQISKTTEYIYRNTDDIGVYNVSATARLRLSKYDGNPGVARTALIEALNGNGFSGLQLSPGIVCRYRLRRVLKVSIRGKVSGTREMARFTRLTMLVSLNEQLKTLNRKGKCS
jgi:hypothetical protein